MNTILKKRWFRIAIGVLFSYLLALVFLILAERSSPDASIQTLADAFWYSIVTLSTVGYGDLYPVTFVGRLLGILFILLSTGMLTFLIGLLLTFTVQQLIPAIRLAILQEKNWCVFSEQNPASEALAEDLYRKDPNAVMLFANTGKDSGSLGEVPHYCFPGSVEQLLKRCKQKSTCLIFFIGSDGAANESGARSVQHFGCPVYCQTSTVPDTAPEDLHFFDSNECIARLYWKTYPLALQEQTVVLIGSGNAAQQILERGLVINIRAVHDGIRYHAFGDWDAFRRTHYRLEQELCGDSSDSPDRLFFPGVHWDQDPELLHNADRIIICSDDVQENLLLCRQLRRFFPTTGQIHLLSPIEETGTRSFGSVRQVFTEELVLRRELNRTAFLMHEIYRKSTDSAPRWETLTEFLRQSNIAAADHLLTKIRLLLRDDGITDVTPETCAAAYQVFCETRNTRGDFYREVEHIRWVRFHSLHNWAYAPIRDNSSRLHPLMLPYCQLTECDQAKDDYAWELLGDLSREMSTLQ